MTKHDFHIALVLLALIATGTLGYQSLNAEPGSVSKNCTFALYFSSFNGCNSSDRIEILPPPFLKERLHEIISPKKIRMHEIDESVDDERSYQRLEWGEKVPAKVSIESDLMPVTKTGK